MLDKPVYYLKGDFRNCPRIVSVNGINLEVDFDGAESQPELPINQYIRDGRNSFSLLMPSTNYLREMVDDRSLCDVSIWVRGTLSGKAFDTKVVDIRPNLDMAVEPLKMLQNTIQSGGYIYVDGSKLQRVEGGSSFDVEDVYLGSDPLEENSIHFVREFDANVPFPEWAFFSGNKILDHPMDEDKYTNLESHIWPLVTNLWDAFEKKDIEEIKNQFEFRSREYDMAFYKEEGETLREMLISLNGYYEEGYPIRRLPPENMQMEVSFGGELVTMVNAGTGNGTVLFYDKDLDMNWFFEATWMYKDGKWMIAR